MLKYINKFSTEYSQFICLCCFLDAWDKTTKLHTQHCYLFHDQHWASCVLCKKVRATFPWTHPPSSWGRACKKICVLCTTSWQRKPGHPRTSYITYIQRVLGYHEVDISAATLAEDQCAWRNLVIACSATEGWWWWWWWWCCFWMVWIVTFLAAIIYFYIVSCFCFSTPKIMDQS